MKSIHRRQQGQRHHNETLVKFFFNQKPYYGFQGDSVLSALIANGVFNISYSAYYRQILGAKGDYSSPLLVGLIQASADKQAKPSIMTMPAEQIEIFENLQVISLNYPSFWNHVSQKLLPRFASSQALMSSQRDYLDCLDIFLAQMGQKHLPHDSLNVAVQHTKKYHHTDIHVVGGGVYGLYAALLAANAGLKVIITDKKSSLVPTAGADALWSSVGNGLYQAVKNHPHITILTQMQVLPIHQDKDVHAIRANRHIHLQHLPQDTLQIHTICAKHTVIATGIVHYPFLYAGHDKMGVMTPTQYLSLYQDYGMTLRQQVLLYTNNDKAYDIIVACDFVPEDIVAIVDTRADLSEKALSFVQRGYKIYHNAEIIAASGGACVEKVNILQKTEQRSLSHNLSVQTIIHSAGQQIDVELLVHFADKIKPALQNRQSWSVSNIHLTDKISVMGYAMGEFSPAARLKAIYTNMQMLLKKWHKKIDFEESLSAQVSFVPDLDTDANILALPKKHHEKIYFPEDIAFSTLKEAYVRQDNIMPLLKQFTDMTVFSLDQHLLWVFICMVGHEYQWASFKIQETFLQIWAEAYSYTKLSALEQVIHQAQVMSLLQSPFNEAYRHEKAHCFYQKRFMLPVASKTQASQKSVFERHYKVMTQDVLLRDMTPVMGLYALKGQDSPLILEKIFETSVIDMALGTVRSVIKSVEGMSFKVSILHTKKHDYLLFVDSIHHDIIGQFLQNYMISQENYNVVLCNMSYQYAAIHILGKNAYQHLQFLNVSLSQEKPITTNDEIIHHSWYGNIELMVMSYPVQDMPSVVCFMPSDAASSILLKLKGDSILSHIMCDESFVEMLHIESGAVLVPDTIEDKRFTTLMCVHPLSQKDLLSEGALIFAQPQDLAAMGQIINVCYSPKYQKMIGYALIEGQIHEWENRTIYAETTGQKHKMNIKLIAPTHTLSIKQEYNNA